MADKMIHVSCLLLVGQTPLYIYIYYIKDYSVGKITFYSMVHLEEVIFLL